jgi:transposase
MVRLRASAMNRGFGLLARWGPRPSPQGPRAPDAMEPLAARGVPETRRRSIAEALAVIDLLDERIAPPHEEPRPFGAADPGVLLPRTIPGIGEPLGLTIAAEIGDVARFGSPRRLIGYAGMAPRVNHSGERSRTGAPSKAGSRTPRWAAVEAAHRAWRANNPGHEPCAQLTARHGKNPAKSAVAREVPIAAWHVLSRDRPFKPGRPRGGSVSASSRCFLAA